MAKAFMVLAGTLVAWGLTTGSGRAEYPVLAAPQTHEACHGPECGSAPCDSCCKKFWAWISYQPLKKPGLCGCCKCCNPVYQPPLYTYFLCQGCSVPYRACPTCCGLGTHGGVAAVQAASGKETPQARILSIEEPPPVSKPALEPTAHIQNVDEPAQSVPPMLPQ